MMSHQKGEVALHQVLLAKRWKVLVMIAGLSMNDDTPVGCLVLFQAAYLPATIWSDAEP